MTWREENREVAVAVDVEKSGRGEGQTAIPIAAAQTAAYGQVG